MTLDDSILRRHFYFRVNCDQVSLSFIYLIFYHIKFNVHGKRKRCQKIKQKSASQDIKRKEVGKTGKEKQEIMSSVSEVW